MSSATILYNAALLAAVSVTAWRTRRRRAPDLAGIAATALTAMLLARILGEDLFGQLRLLGHAVFIHAVLLAAGSAVVLRRASRKASVAFGAIALALAVIGVDAYWIEPRAIEVNHVSLTSAKLTRRLRIAILADLQFDEFGDHERAALSATIDERPDLILLAGDYVQAAEPQRTRAREAFNAHLKGLGFSAPLGVYAVRGNVDPDDWAKTFEGLQITVFETTSAVVRDEFAVTGLAMKDSFDPTMGVAPSERFHIVLGHAPDFALGDIDGDLLVAGHTHGGQVQLPFIGPLLTLSAVPRAWASGVTSLGPTKTLIVSRGTGMERRHAPRVRFRCRPEVVVVDAGPP